MNSEAPLSPSRESIIESWYSSKELATALGRMNPEALREDLKQEIFVELCKLPADKLQGMHARNEVRWFIFRLISNMIKSDQSDFYRKFRKFTEVFAPNYICVQADGTISRPAPGLGDEDGDRSAGSGGKAPQSLTHLDELELDEGWIGKLDEAVATLDPYEADLFRLYTQMGENCVPVAQATKINERSVRFAITQAKRKLQTYLKSC